MSPTEDAASTIKAGKRRVFFPLFPSQEPGSLDLTGKDIANSEVAEDLRRHGRLEGFDLLLLP